MAKTTDKISESQFSTPSRVWGVCDLMQRVEDYRAFDRSKINTLFNGGRPYTPDEVEKFQVQVNVNWMIGPRIMQDANRQLNNALLHPGYLFSCTTDKGPIEKRDVWGQEFTKNLHIPIQRGRSGKKHHFLIKNRNATICMHGIGALLWTNEWSWMPRFVPLEDLLIPTDTYCDLSNLRYFAVNLYLTPGELVDMTQGEKVDKGWNTELVKQVLDNVKAQTSESIPSTWRQQPEAMMEIYKQNQGWYYNDAIPKVKMRAFYWQEVDKPQRWFRHIILREAYGEANTDKFIYDGTGRPFATHLDHILNVQYGDSSLVAPMKYHSVRGLGVPLYAPVEALNRIQCEFIQHVLEQLKMYFKIKDPADRDRLKQVVLQAYGYIPEGLEIVPQAERHQIDSNLVEMAMSGLRQIMQENSSSYIQSANDGTSKERTAFEVNAMLNQANVMVSGMLQAAETQEGFLYEEYKRRFCAKNSADLEVLKFQKKCKEAGIPENILHDSTTWEITPERVLGGGDRTLAQAQAQWLMQNRMVFDPQAQQRILRRATNAILDNPSEAQLLVPEAPVEATAGTYAAENVFGTLMTGNQCSLRQGVDQIGYIEAMLKMMNNVVQRIQNTDNIGTPDDLIGLMTVAQNLAQHLSILAGDDAEKQRVKQYSEVLGNLINEIKGFAARQAQAKEAQQPDPKAQADAQTKIMSAQVKAQIATMNAELKRQHKQVDFSLEQSRKNAATLADIRREDLKAHSENLNNSMLAAADAIRKTKVQKTVDNAAN